MDALRARARAAGLYAADSSPEAIGTTAEFPGGVERALPLRLRETDDHYYPVAVPVETLALAPADGAARAAAARAVVDLMREVYTGTKFDPTLDERGGAYGDAEELPGGPRRVSIQRTSFWSGARARLFFPRARLSAPFLPHGRKTRFSRAHAFFSRAHAFQPRFSRAGEKGVSPARAPSLVSFARAAAIPP